MICKWLKGQGVSFGISIPLDGTRKWWKKIGGTGVLAALNLLRRPTGDPNNGYERRTPLDDNATGEPIQPTASNEGEKKPKLDDGQN